MKHHIALITLLSLSAHASEYIVLDDPSQTIIIKNKSQLMAMIYYTGDDNKESWIRLRPTRKYALYSHGNSSASITFLVNKNIFVWYPRINTSQQLTIPTDCTQFIINPKMENFREI